MGRPSKIDRMPEEIRDAITALRGEGRTIDEILEHLKRLNGVFDDMPSRSGLGRHIQGLDALAERANRGKVIAEALVSKLSDAPESRQARLNVQLIHGLVTEVIMNIADAAQTGQPVAMGPKDIHDLAKSIDHLSRAAKNDAQLTLELREHAQSAQDEAAPAPDRETTDFRLPEAGR
jgi:hypothetical protein